MDRVALKSRLDEAHKMLALAEEAMELAMRGLTSGATIEKQMIATVMEDAFEKVRAARREVVDVEKLLDAPG